MSVTGAQDSESPWKEADGAALESGVGGWLPWQGRAGGVAQRRWGSGGSHAVPDFRAGRGVGEGGCGRVETLEDTRHGLVSHRSLEKVLQGPTWDALERAAVCGFSSLVPLKTEAASSPDPAPLCPPLKVPGVRWTLHCEKHLSCSPVHRRHG